MSKSKSKDAVTHPQVESVTIGEGKDARAVLTPVSLITEADEAASAAYDLQWRKEGVAELTTKLQELQSSPASLGNSMFRLSQNCLKAANGNFEIAVTYFEGSTGHAARALQAKHHKDGKAQPIADLLPSWSATISPLMTALKKGINVNDTHAPGSKDGSRVRETAEPVFPSVSSIRREVAKRGKQEKAAAAAKATGNVPAFATGTEPLNAAMKGLSAELARLSPEQQTQAAQMIVDVTAQVRALREATSTQAEQADEKKAALMRGGSKAA